MNRNFGSAIYQGKRYPLEDVVGAEPEVGIFAGYGVFCVNGKDYTCDLPEDGEKVQVYGPQGRKAGFATLTRN